MKLKRNYIFWGILGNLIQYGIPLSYIIWQYEIFQFEEAQKSLTGWGFVIIGIIFFFFKDKIMNMVRDYNNHLGEVSKKAKWGFLFLGLGIFLALASLWITGAKYFMLTLGISNLISLIFYTPYYSRKTEYQELKKLIKEERQKAKIKGVTI